MLDLKNLQLLSRSPCRPAVLLRHTKFCWNRTIGRWVMANKAKFKMAAATILNLKKIWSRDCNRVQYLMQYTKFYQNRTIFSLRYGDLTIFKWQRSAMLDFKNLQFLSSIPCRHAVLLPRTKFRWNRTIGRWVMAKNAIFKMAAPPSWILKNSVFGRVTVIGFNICCSVPNLIKIGWFFTEIW